MNIKKIITEAHMAGQHNQGVDASWSEVLAYYEKVKQEPDSNVVNPLLGEVAEIIKSLKIKWDNNNYLDDYDSYSNGFNDALIKLKQKISGISA